MANDIKSLGNRGNAEIRDLISIIKEGVVSISRNAKYGSYANLHADLSRIKIAISKLDSKIQTIPTRSVKHRKILVPYDGSPFSKRALREALDFAKAYGSTIYLATVVDISNVVPPGLILSGHFRTFEQVKKSIKSSTESALKSIKEECKENGIEAEKYILEGPTVKELLNLIKRNDIDLVVIGSQGRSGLSKIMALGSVSRKISESATCPVMIIH
jgi:nucleotide-binding universal stress UspA family protein